ncbi:hypothetical protein RUE5091_04525 [Ruegeria denitrificans]|uniref:Uncharacterized protein n=1 Tax=Ruegeria denitrificans TaxID=1715692 RepID=A0A0P1IKM7_9RHOB|nr:hypothetical protein RUE5091_04525 [Ruegeria denitrificans]
MLSFFCLTRLRILTYSTCEVNYWDTKTSFAPAHGTIPDPFVRAKLIAY